MLIAHQKIAVAQIFVSVAIFVEHEYLLFIYFILGKLSLTHGELALRRSVMVERTDLTDYVHPLM